MNRAEIFMDSGQYYVHYAIGGFHESTEPYETFEEASQGIKDWLDAPKSHPY